MSGFSSWSEVATTTLPSTALFNFSSISGTNAIAVGRSTSNTSIIYYSYDSGTTWTKSLSSVIADSYALSACSIDGSYAVAIGQNLASSTQGYLYNSTDGGVTWSEVSTSSVLQNCTLLYSCKIVGSYAIAVGFLNTNIGIIYSSNDGGINWAPSASDFSNATRFYSCAISGSHAIVNGSSTNGADGVIYISTNTGSGFTTWTQITSTTFTNSIFNVNSCAMDGSYAIVDGKNSASTVSKVYYSTNSGASWTPSDTTIDPSANVLVCCSISGTNAIVPGRNTAATQGYLYVSTDSGKTLTPVATPDVATFNFCSISGTNAIAVGRSTSNTSIVYYSYNSGTTWTKSLSSSIADSYALNACSISGIHAVAVGKNNSAGTQGYIYYSTNLSPSNVTCFKKDTKILTDKGYKYVQNLRKGDLVKTSRDGYKKIDMIGKQEIYHPASEERVKHQLYKCTSAKYPEVFEDLVITGCHSILLVDEFPSEEEREKTREVNGYLYVTDGMYRIPACADKRTSVYKPAGNYTIYHFALEHDDYYMNYGVYANGLLVETCSKRYLKEISNMELIE